jgi:GDP-L-fucose synthase
MTGSGVPYELAGRRIFVAGHQGMVGSALVRRLARERCEILAAGRSELDLRRQADVEAWFARHRPHAVLLAAATVGGIGANDAKPSDFLYDNLAIAANVIQASHGAGVEKLLFLGSSCVYPRLTAQPIQEDSLLSGPLEPTNQWYAVAKIAGIKLCQAYRRQHHCDFISAMPTNLYGPHDNFDLETSHVLPALIAKAHAAKIKNARSLVVWGSGRPRREFLHVDDAADAMVHVLKSYSEEQPINVGTGSDIPIAELAALVGKIVGFTGPLEFDRSKPDGTPAKRLDIRRLSALGWRPRIRLDEGIRMTYAWYLDNVASPGDQGVEARAEPGA